MKVSLIVILSMVIAAGAVAESGGSTPEPEPGRFQLMLGFGPNAALYFLDTGTGQMWVKRDDGSWKPVDSPIAKAELADEGEPDEGRREKVELELTIPESGIVEMPMRQRETRVIPGSSETLHVRLGDVTAGQVFVELLDSDWEVVVDRKSVKDGEYFGFKVGDDDYFLQITDMVNSLLGEDLCNVVISNSEPEKREEKAEKPPAKKGKPKKRDKQ